MTTSADPGARPEDPAQKSTAAPSGGATDPELRAAEQADSDSDPGTLNPRSGAAARDESSQEYPDTDADPNNLNPRDLRQGGGDDG